MKEGDYGLAIRQDHRLNAGKNFSGTLTPKSGRRSQDYCRATGQHKDKRARRARPASACSISLTRSVVEALECVTGIRQPCECRAALSAASWKHADPEEADGARDAAPPDAGRASKWWYHAEALASLDPQIGAIAQDQCAWNAIALCGMRVVKEFLMTASCAELALRLQACSGAANIFANVTSAMGILVATDALLSWNYGSQRNAEKVNELAARYGNPARGLAPTVALLHA